MHFYADKMNFYTFMQKNTPYCRERIFLYKQIIAPVAYCTSCASNQFDTSR